ncbi:MAG: MFS transporter [Acidocella sp. 20-57-95]|nr:MAG: MFS transporter [Acidocella sp. 20-57-95]OYV57939.1 MAG: MFS transporter [Acidocella sp. 21-58-7]HQT63177.1 MFS transporter [Acidocella sp.]HQU05452.1 MFS transporter [Acidocella sp.]
MSQTTVTPDLAPAAATAPAANITRTVFPVLGAVSLCHMLNDMMQSLLPAIYPILKGGFNLNFAQVGLLTLVFQITASLLQPMIGRFTDRRPMPYSLPFGMGFTFTGLLTLGFAPSYPVLLLGAALLGIGSSIFHPESSRIARLASGGRHGLAQSIFQVGGNFGQSLGPLLAAFIILPRGQQSISYFGVLALVAMGILTLLSHWYTQNGNTKPVARKAAARHSSLSAPQVKAAMAVLIALMFSKFFYLSSFINYYVFYLIQHFHLTTQDAQVDLFIFMAASAAGTVLGGPIGDKIGRKPVIWASIAGVIPFTMVLPYVGLNATILLSVIIGLVLSSAFSAIVVYAQELMPGQVGMVSGLFFGLAFGLGGIGAAALGELADLTSITFVYRICAFLPFIGLLTALLPNLSKAD